MQYKRPSQFSCARTEQRRLQSVHPAGMLTDDRIIYAKTSFNDYEMGILFMFDALQAADAGLFSSASAPWTYLFSFKQYYPIDWFIVEPNSQ